MSQQAPPSLQWQSTQHSSAIHGSTYFVHFFTDQHTEHIKSSMTQMVSGKRNSTNVVLFL